jgi:NADH-ubiquinone oxidoreductase chain 6
MRLLAPAFKFHFKEGRRTMILSVLSSPALVSGLMVVRAKNPVHSVLFPILVFCDTSGLLILLGLDFSAMIFPVVHIGAIAVSFLFVVMMFNIQIAEIHEEVLRYLPVSGIIGLIFWWEMFFILDNETIPLLPTHRNTTPLRYTVYAGKVRSWTNLETLGNLLYTYYSVWFLVSSLILLVAMIGAIVLTMHRTTKVKRQDVFRRNALDSRRNIMNRRFFSSSSLSNGEEHLKRRLAECNISEELFLEMCSVMTISRKTVIFLLENQIGIHEFQFFRDSISFLGENGYSTEKKIDMVREMKRELEIELSQVGDYHVKPSNQNVRPDAEDFNDHLKEFCRLEELEKATEKEERLALPDGERIRVEEEIKDDIRKGISLWSAILLDLENQPSDKK